MQQMCSSISPHHISQPARSPPHLLPLSTCVVCLVWSASRSEWAATQPTSSWWSCSPTRPTRFPYLPSMENQPANHWLSRESHVRNQPIISMFQHKFRVIFDKLTELLTHVQCPCHLRENWGFGILLTAPWRLTGMLLPVPFASTSSPISLRVEMQKKWVRLSFHGITTAVMTSPFLLLQNLLSVIVIRIYDDSVVGYFSTDPLSHCGDCSCLSGHQGIFWSLKKYYETPWMWFCKAYRLVLVLGTGGILYGCMSPCGSCWATAAHSAGSED